LASRCTLLIGKSAASRTDPPRLNHVKPGNTSLATGWIRGITLGGIRSRMCLHPQERDVRPVWRSYSTDAGRLRYIAHRRSRVRAPPSPRTASYRPIARSRVEPLLDIALGSVVDNYCLLTGSRCTHRPPPRLNVAAMTGGSRRALTNTLRAERALPSVLVAVIV